MAGNLSLYTYFRTPLYIVTESQTNLENQLKLSLTMALPIKFCSFSDVIIKNDLNFDITIVPVCTNLLSNL